jgi:hypothetical protein
MTRRAISARPYVEGHTKGHLEGRVVGGREATDLHRAVPFAKKLLYNWRLTVATKGALSGLLDDLVRLCKLNR